MFLLVREGGRGQEEAGKDERSENERNTIL